MKNFLKSIVADFLALFARGVVARYRPKIVMITGSVGKTSTKDAVAAALAPRFYLRASDKSFNSEFGVPFTIFGVKNPWGNPSAWFQVLKEAATLLLLPNHYPKLLVLEVGADRPGDLEKILRIATPDALVITRLPEVPVHVEAYASPEAVREEEFSPAYHLPAAAPLIFSSDDPFAVLMAARVPAKAITYSIDSAADISVSNVDFYTNGGEVKGMKARVRMGEENGDIVIEGSIGRQQIRPVAAAIATARAFGMTLAETLAALEKYEPPPGRGRLFKGINGSIIVDDTYNSSPVASERALTTLKEFPKAKRSIAVLGDMLELGRYSVSEHERIGTLAATCADVVVSVGIRAQKIAESARAAGMPAARVLSYDDSRTAASALPGFIEPGDVVLVKGSQSIRTERIVEALLANPTADISKLVRQEREWKRRSQ